MKTFGFVAEGSTADRLLQAGSWIRTAHDHAVHGRHEAALQAVVNAEMLAGHSYPQTRQTLERIQRLVDLETPEPVVIRINPDEKVNLPPIYHITFLVINGEQTEPDFPLTIIPAAQGQKVVTFIFAGFNTYQLDKAFEGYKGGDRVTQIDYTIHIGGKQFRFTHPFKMDVRLTAYGLRGSRPIMAPFEDLEGLPDLPEGWTYFQFIN